MTTVTPNFKGDPPPKVRKPLRRTAMRASRRRPAMPTDVAEAVRMRSGGQCEARVSDQCRDFMRTVGQPMGGAELHHRKTRKQGGSDTPANLLACCRWCHAWVHAHPAVSYRMGLLIRGSDPDPTKPYSREVA